MHICHYRGLITGRHELVKYEIEDIALRALPENRVRDEPLINQSRVTVPPEMPTTPSSSSSAQASPPTPSTPHTLENVAHDDRGDISIRGLWERQTECILDIVITNLDAKTYCNRDPETILWQKEKAKKRKYMSACL